MKRSGLRLLIAALLLAVGSVSAFAQGSATSTLNGTVVDADGGFVPGAKVEVKNNATGVVLTTISSSNGTFNVPALSIGNYTVTVSLTNFKTTILKDVVVTAGTPANVTAKLEVGVMTDSVLVEGATEIVQTTSSAASTTLNTKAIMSLPVSSRNTLDFVAFLPGVTTPGTVRQSTVNGLPQSSLNITVDGVNVQDNYLKTTDGFFARMSPRLDAVEEVTVTTAGQGADGTGQGAVQIKFSTRSGGNKLTGSGYHFYQSDKLNSNTYVNNARNLPKGPLTLNQPGFRVGGPVYIPGLYDGRNKAFFFLNYEELRQPSTITTNTTVLLPDAQNGIFRCAACPAGGINVLSLAAANGFPSTQDPIVAQLFNDMRNAVNNSPGTFSTVTGALNTERFTWLDAVKSNNNYPTVRGDYNLTSAHRVTYSYSRNSILATPDTTNTRQRTVPGFPVVSEQASVRYAASLTVRSTLGSRLVNEAHIGGSGGPTQFSPSLSASMWNGTLANQGGFNLGISASGSSNAGSGATYSQREPTTRLFEDTVNWLKGSHSVSFGASYTRFGIWLISGNTVPSIAFGVDTTDPAIAMFSAANFPGSTSAERNSAAAFYATLVGRVTAITNTARLNGNTGQYVYGGDSYAAGRLQEMDFFAQDNWRMRPNLSMNVGLRYAIQPPFYATNGSYSTATVDALFGPTGYNPNCDLSNVVPADCNMFQPGLLNGARDANGNFVKSSYINLAKGVKTFNTDTNNLAPTIGVNWTPTFSGGGFLGWLVGKQGDTSISAGFARSFEREGMATYTDIFSSNPGLTQSATRNKANGNLTPPIMFRDGAAVLGPPPTCPPLPAPKPTGCLLAAPEYPLTNTTTTGEMDIFDPKFQTPYADSWNIGWQRSLGRKSAIEVRYVGTRGRQQISDYNYNGEPNIQENGFLAEFRLAQQNLAQSIANGCGGTGQPACSFAYLGPGTGTNPLPIYLAFFSGTPASGASNAAAYTSALFTNSSFVNPLGARTVNPFTPAGTNSSSGLAGDPVRQANSIAAGLPVNFFRVNPDMLGGIFVRGNGGFTNYKSIQIQFRRRLSDGFQMDANYVGGNGNNSQRFSFRVPRETVRTVGTGGDVAHTVKLTAVYELPFGQGKRFFSGANGLVDRLAGGWQVSATARFQSGRLFDMGNIRIVGMTEQEARDAFKLRFGTLPDGSQDPTIIYAWPQDIIDESMKAFSTSATSASGYGALGPPTAGARYFAPADGPDCYETVARGFGDCGTRTFVVQGPIVKNVDFSLRKLTRVAGRSTFELSFDVFNLFKWNTFVPTTGIGGTQLSSYQAGLPGSNRTAQIGSRFTW